MKRAVSFFYFVSVIMTMVGFTIKEPNNISSPNAVSLGQYGDIPVSLYTGIPNINIPLYEVPVGMYKIPISLSYHTSAIRPDQRAGWVGTGWTLNCGGAIVRTIHGHPDEMATTGTSDIKKGYYYNHSKLDRPDWGTQDFLNQYVIESVPKELDYIDLEPDKFSFNFLGYSGCFFLNPEGEWVVKCDKYLRVKNNYLSLTKIPFTTKTAVSSTHSKAIQGFTLIDENGVQYEFGYDMNAIEFSVSFFNQNEAHWISSGWNITRIIYPNGDEAKFIYDRGDLTCQLWYNFYGYIENTGDQASIVIDNRVYKASGNLISPSFLKTIEFPLGKVSFNSMNTMQLEYSNRFCVEFLLSSQSSVNTNFIFLKYGLNYGDPILSDNNIMGRLENRSLNNIIVADNNGKTTNRIDFRFFKNRMYRTFLQQITIQNTRKYSFEYNDCDSVPGYLSRKTDHWGYYNGIDSKLNYAQSEKEYYSTKQPDAEKMDVGILTKIIYPTGGYSQFEYEPHRYGAYLNPTRSMLIKSDNENALAGGLRIKKIINSTGENIEEKEYFYTRSYAQNKGVGRISSGILGGLPKYGMDLINPSGSYIKVFHSYDSYYTGGINAEGSHIGYSEVVERNSDGSFTEYHFTNFSTKKDYQPDKTTFPLEYTTFSSREQERGLLVKQCQYDADFRQTGSSTFAYENGTEHFVPAVSFEKRIYQNTYTIESTAYRCYTFVPLVSKEESYKVYEDGAAIKNTRNYQYNDIRQIKRISASANAEDSLLTSYTYLWETAPTSIVGPLKEVKQSHYHKATATQETVGHTLYDYMLYGDYNYVPTQVSFYHGDSSDCDKFTYRYDDSGRKVFGDKNGADGTVYIWGYNSQYLVAKVENATYEEVRRIIGNFKKFSDEATPNFAKIAKLREALPDAFVTSYTHIPNVGVSSITHPNGTSEYFRYDILGRLICTTDNEGNIVKAYDYNYAE